MVKQNFKLKILILNLGSKKYLIALEEYLALQIKIKKEIILFLI